MWPTSPLPRARGLEAIPRPESEEGSSDVGRCRQTNRSFSLTSLVSLFLTEENSPLKGLEVILKGLNVN